MVDGSAPADEALEGAGEATADASPEKRFFIYMLIKDIELLPAVLDLVDNSVDAAREHAEDQADLSAFAVDIEALPTYFRIQDNCGGLDLEKAEKYAFRFGRPVDFRGAANSVGQFGVGMKRALFKLGRDFVVSSTTDQTRFVLPINVDRWIADPDPRWKFVFDVADPAYVPNDAEARGTEIRVNELHESVAEDFASTLLLGRMRVDLELRHQAALEAGLVVHVNGVPLRPSRPELAISADLNPVHIRMPVAGDGGEVRMSLFAGVVKPEMPDASDDDDADEFPAAPKAGWYVFCNNRLLLAADRTELTGWGDGANAYHPQYRNFRGYVYLDGDSAYLPWNTTKTGVDRDSRIFRIARAQMTNALRSVQTFINQAKQEAQRVPTENRVLAASIAASSVRDLGEIPLSPVMRYPAAAQGPENHTRRIAYAVPRDEFEQVAIALDTDSAPTVGRQTFDFFLRTQVNDESA
jgi:Histidine kinase-, DNA gyrase B-, and HSP90-like ATPase